MTRKPALILAGGAVVLLIVGMAIGSVLVKQPQQVSLPQAAVPGGTATLNFSNPATVASGQDVAVALILTTPTTPGNAGIIGVKAVLTAEGNYLSLSDSDISGSLPSPWTYVRKEAVTSGNTITVTIEAVYLQAGTSGYDATNSTQFASLNFSTQGSGPAQMSLDTALSEIRTKQGNADILSDQATSGNITVTGSGGGPTPTPTGNPTPTPTGIGGDGGPTPTPTAGTTNACGGTCGSNANCNAGLGCYNGYCRNPSCTTSTNCTCSLPTPTPTGSTALRTTPTPRTLPTPTARTTTTPTPTASSANPFLGQDPGYQAPQVSIPPLAAPEPTPAPKLNFFQRIIAFIINLLQSIIGRR